ncbi:toprim domain-containing protein [Falsiroseomonas sp. CW058]|uniref:toprim domain-containing protein n=1 Tax=Falsiroseomonas sp. CW058 TaxID=3388664 RepID=UPI003D30FE31
MTEKPTLAEVLDRARIRPLHWRAEVEQRLVCPECGGGKTREKSLALRLDADGGAVWKCHRGHCGWSDNIPAGAVRGGRSTPPARPQAAPPRPAEQHPEGERERTEALYDFFQKRGISRRTVDEMGIYLRRGVWFPQLADEEVKTTTAIVFPYVEGGEVANHKYRGYRMVEVEDEAGVKRRIRDKIHRQDTGAKKTLFNGDCLSGLGPEDTVFLVEGEFDVAALWEAGAHAAISLPDGASDRLRDESDPERANDKRFFPLMERIEDIRAVGKIVIATDSDTPGTYLAEEFARRIGKEIVWRVRWPKGCKDANDVLMAGGVEALRDCLASAERWVPDGIYDGSAAADMAIHREASRPAPLTTGLRSLDALFRLPQHGALVVLTGPPGHGKSTLFNALMVQAGLHHGWHSIICSPEMDRLDLAAYMSSVLVGKPFYGERGMSDGDIATASAFLRNHVTFLEPEGGPPSLDWVKAAIRKVHARRGSKIVVLDPWGEFDIYASTLPDLAERRAEEAARRAMLFPDFLGRRLAELREMAHELGMVVVVVAHPQKLQRDREGKYPTPTGYDIAGGATWYNRAEVGLTIERVEGNEACVHVWKARHRLYASYGVVRLRFEPETGRFFDLTGPSLVDSSPMAASAASEGSEDDDVPWVSA